MTQSQLIKRVEELERDMREMKKQFGNGGRKSSGEFFGMFRNDQDFKEAMELGAAYRRAQRPGYGKKHNRSST